MNMKKRVENIIAALGNSEEEILRTLAEYGIDNRDSGYYHRSKTCPIAQYITQRIHTERMADEDVYGVTPDRIRVDGTYVYFSATNPALSNVIEDFDRGIYD